MVAGTPENRLNIDVVGHGATKEEVRPDGRTAEGARAASASLGRIAQAMFHCFASFLEDVCWKTPTPRDTAQHTWVV